MKRVQEGSRQGRKRWMNVSIQPLIDHLSKVRRGRRSERRSKPTADTDEVDMDDAS